MQSGFCPLILTCAALLLAPAGGATDLTPLPRKKLIMSGWDQPDAAQFRRDLAAFENYPFDGVILTVPGKKPDGTSHFVDTANPALKGWAIFVAQAKTRPLEGGC